MVNETHLNNRDACSSVTGAYLHSVSVQAVSSSWESVVTQICQWQSCVDLIPTQLTVVLPFVQLIAPVRQAWCQRQGTGFLPRFETTQTWLTRLGGLHQPGKGPTGDLVIDCLQARSWLNNLVQEQVQVLADVLVNPLAIIANELVQAAAAVAPQNRHVYWQLAEHTVSQTQPGATGVEAALGPLAVAWAKATETFNTDVLFSAAIRACDTNTMPAGLVVVQAGGFDTLTRNVFEQWPLEKRLWLNLDADHQEKPQKYYPVRQEVSSSPLDVNTLGDPVARIAQINPPSWQVASDAEDEAERAAAHVIHLLNQGVMPVALCSQDRPIARRVWALLNRQNIPMADETGWTLSTTRCAALVMSLVKSAAPQALANTVLDAFKALPPASSYTQGLNELEVCLRKMSVAAWPIQRSSEDTQYWPQSARNAYALINGLLLGLRGNNQYSPRNLWEHLQALDQALRACGGWGALQSDEAGREIMQTLHLYELHLYQDFTQVSDDLAATIQSSAQTFLRNAQNISMSYTEFSRWVSQVLETVTFIPPAPDKPQVILTPLARLMLRPFAAVVIPGCDDSRLTSQPSFPGFWRESQRAELGLMTRERWWQRLQAQWVQALSLPHVMLMWRLAQGSQPLGPASLVLRAIQQKGIYTDEKNGHTGAMHEDIDTAFISGISHDARPLQALMPAPVFAPVPRPGHRLVPCRLSASAYKALRECPYRFYAMYMLQLRDLGELDKALDRRDYGNWLHAVLRQFHVVRASRINMPTRQADEQLLESCAQEHAQGLDEASTIPWQARWPALKAAYLNWLGHYEEEGGQFVRAEFGVHYPLTQDIMLQGRIDRLDQQHGKPILIDYKTERRVDTERRVKDPYEDVQLPFYALLAQGECMVKGAVATDIANAQQARAIYLSLDDRENKVKAVEQDQLQGAKEALSQGIMGDMTRLKNGFPAYPLGQEPSCTYCDVKGLCRKPYWSKTLNLTDKEHNIKMP